jgi:type VI secretion system protein ImpC
MPSSSEWVGFTVGAESKKARIEVAPEHPFRIAILGDFSGRGAQGAVNDVPIARRRAHLIDRDNFEEVLAAIEPSVGEGLTIREMDDFHPDHLYESVPVFRALRNLRKRLADPATFPEAAGELLGVSKGGGAAPVAPEVSGKDLLEDILGGPAPARPAPPRDDFQKYLKDIVSPHLVAGQDPRQPELLAQVDAAATREMRSLLASPAFKTVESLWRSVFFLVRSLETSEDLQVSLIDISRDELVHDLLAEDKDLESTGMYKLLVEETGEWSVLAAAFTFGPDTDDLILLARCAGVAKAAGAPWVAGAGSALVGSPSFATCSDPDDWAKQPHGGWEALRELPETRFVGLAAPRFLIRLPYGKSSDPCERFAFEEIDSPGDQHEAYLWANPAVACAQLLGEAFEKDGWDMRPGTAAEIYGLPLHLYKKDGEMVSKPCAEIALTERAANRMLDTGIMPLASIRGSDRIRLLRMQSIAQPATGLAGRWTGAK